MLMETQFVDAHIYAGTYMNIYKSRGITVQQFEEMISQMRIWLKQ